MGRFVVARVVRLVAVLVAIIVVSFLFMHAIPGDPVAIRLGDHATPQAAAALRATLGLDKPWYAQLGIYLDNAMHGNFGTSILDDQPVIAKLGQYFPATIELTIGAMLVAIVFGIPLGIFAALRYRTIFDAAATGIALLGISIPVFWLGWMLVYLLAVVPMHWGWSLFPISGRISLQYHVQPITHLLVLDALLRGNVPAALDALRHLILPALTLGTIPLAIVAKITRTGMLDVLRSDYVRTARAKGLGEWAVIVHHALRNALVPILTVIGLQFGLLLGGAVLTEQIFAWPGVGRLAFDAIGNRDMPVINGCLVLFAGLFVLVNAAIDVLYAAVNPRIRYGA